MSDERTYAELEQVVRTLTRHFDADTVYIIGNQAVILAAPSAPREARMSREFDAYPGNNRTWERKNPDDLASEEINALFGEGSRFHSTHGYYIDGVDEQTAILPSGWKERAVSREITVDGRKVKAIAPALDDLVVSKLARLDPKDKAFVEICHAAGLVDLDAVGERLSEALHDEAVRDRAAAYLSRLASGV